MSVTTHIQESCKQVALCVLHLFFWSCSGSPSATVEPMSFEQTNFAYVDDKCPISFSIVNTSGTNYIVSLLSATFSDETTQNTLELTGEPLASAFSSLDVPAVSKADAVVEFDLSAFALRAPIRVTLVVIGFQGNTVTHFVGEAVCE